MAEPEPSYTDSELGTAEALINLAKGGDLYKGVSKEAYERASIILSKWRTLGKILDRHEGTIRSRWMKKSVTWRKTILSKTWPDMALCHRPDIRHFSEEALRYVREEDLPVFEKKKAPKDFFLLPYINMDDLSRDKPILCLLNSRARDTPSRFVDHDLENCEFGAYTRNIVELVLPGFSMQLDGVTVQTYGRLLSVRDDFTFRAGYAPGAGLWILEIQQKLMDFLVKFCEAVLDKTVDILLTQFAIVAQLAPLQIWSPWRTIENLATYTPYMLPPELDFERLAKKLFARHSVAQDHVKALREDPGYFEDTVLQFADHRPEAVGDCLGNKGSTYGGPEFWDCIFSAMVRQVHRSVALWDVLHQQSLVLLDIGKQYKGKLDPRYPLPPEYKEQILLFHGLLKHCAEDRRQILSLLLTTSPPLRGLLERKIVDEREAVVFRESADMENDPLLWIYTKIRDPVKFDFYGHKIMVDEMERLLFSQPKQRKRISPLVAEFFSGFGLLTLMEYEVEKYPPWGAELAFSDQGNIDWIKEEIPNILSADLYELGEQSNSLVLNKFGNPYLVDFSYPCDQRRTRDSTHAMWKAEKNLDMFWCEVDMQYEKLTGKTLIDAFAKRFTIGFKLERTQEWVEPVERLFSEKVAHNDQSLEAETLEKPLSGLQFEEKVSGNPDRAMLLGKDIFQLDQRGFRVVKALFHVPSDQDGPRTIPWADFLHFMSIMHFTPMKFYGSLWHFFSFTWPECQFHEPEPDSHISLRVAMSMGRRLKQNYNWHLDMFASPEREAGGKKKGKKKGKGKGMAS